MNTMWIEIKKFIKSNFKVTIIGSVILGTIFAVFISFLNRESTDVSENVQNEETEFSVAYFQYYVERPDGVSFTNLNIIKEYFTRDDLLEEMSTELNLSLEQVALEEEEGFNILGDLEFEESDEISEDMLLDIDTLMEINNDFILLNMYRGETSHLYTFTVTSNNESRNLEISEYFYDFVSNDKVPFYQDKNIYLFAEPQLAEDKIRIDDTVEIDTENEEENSLVLNLIASYILAFILVLGFYVLKSLFSNKLIYSFSYLWSENHLFFLFDPMLGNKNELTQFLSYPENREKIIITEQELSNNLENLLSVNNFNLETNLSVYHNVTDVKLDSEVEEIILLVNEGETSRKWYKEQQKLLSIYNHAIVKIVQMNK